MAFLLGFLNGPKSGGTSVATLPKLGNASPILMQYVSFDIRANGQPSFNELKW